MDTDGEIPYHEVLKGFCTTLKGLEVRGLNEEQGQSVPIHFPLLEYLKINPTWSSHTWLVQATTPALCSYTETKFCRTAQAILHKDVKKVTHLQCWEMPQLHSFIALRVLQLWATGATGVAEQLQRHKEICPMLKLIEFKKTWIEIEGLNRICLEIKVARPQVDVIIWKTWSRLPGSCYEFQVSSIEFSTLSYSSNGY